jgi:hypothetical protein
VAEHLHNEPGMERHRQQGFHRIHLEPALRQVIDGGESPGCGEVPPSLAATLLAGVDERDYFYVGIVDVGADVEVVDPAETDEGRPDRPIIRTE